MGFTLYMRKFKMKKILIFLMTCVSAIAFGAVGITDGNLAVNVGKLYRDFYIEVPMTPSPFNLSEAGNQRIVQSWSDFELKVIDKWGNNICFSSTIYLNSVSVVNGHIEIIDKTPKIFYFTIADPTNERCYGEKRQFTNFSSSIGVEVYKRGEMVSTVWLYPSLDSTETRRVKNWTGKGVFSGYKEVVWGEYIREIFTNPENTIIVWRQSRLLADTLYTETGKTTQKRWIPVQPIYYGDFKFKK